MRIWLLIVAMAISGCTAADRATDAISTLVKTSATAIIEKGNFTSTTAEANGTISDPVYKVSAKYVQGVEVEVGVRGVHVEGRLHASGTGPDKPLSPETIAALREKGLSDDAIDVIEEAARVAIQKITEAKGK